MEKTVILSQDSGQKFGSTETASKIRQKLLEEGAKIPSGFALPRKRILQMQSYIRTDVASFGGAAAPVLQNFALLCRYHRKECTKAAKTGGKACSGFQNGAKNHGGDKKSAELVGRVRDANKISAIK